MAKRPDVLVVESGEIELPGEVEMKNIGQPRNEVYACLAETIVLALEGRFENLTVGRQIEWEKVREIDRMGLKHGMKLAAISGMHGPFSDVDIARVRRRACGPRAAGRQGEARPVEAGDRPRAQAAQGREPGQGDSAGGEARREAGRQPARRALPQRPPRKSEAPHEAGLRVSQSRVVRRDQKSIPPMPPPWS